MIGLINDFIGYDSFNNIFVFAEKNDIFKSIHSWTMGQKIHKNKN